jgi:transcriptional regulator with XRE-family HTH domain
VRTPAQRGPIGNWLRDERIARGWTSASVARRHLARSGIRVAESVYAEWESGTRIPSERQQEALEGFYGSKPAAGGVLADTALLVQLTRIAEALERLAPPPGPAGQEAHETEIARIAIADARAQTEAEVVAGRRDGGGAPERPERRGPRTRLRNRR